MTAVDRLRRRLGAMRLSAPVNDLPAVDYPSPGPVSKNPARSPTRWLTPLPRRSSAILQITGRSRDVRRARGESRLTLSSRSKRASTLATDVQTASRRRPLAARGPAVPRHRIATPTQAIIDIRDQRSVTPGQLYDTPAPGPVSASASSGRPPVESRHQVAIPKRPSRCGPAEHGRRPRGRDQERSHLHRAVISTGPGHVSAEPPRPRSNRRDYDRYRRARAARPYLRESPACEAPSRTRLSMRFWVRLRGRRHGILAVIAWRLATPSGGYRRSGRLPIIGPLRARFGSRRSTTARAASFAPSPTCR